MPVAATQAPLIDSQDAFTKVWSHVGLKDLIPLRFGLANDPKIPSARGTVKQVGEWVYSYGRTIRMQIDIEVYLKEGQGNRRQMELLVEQMNNVGKVIAGITEWKQVTGQIQSDINRFAGQPVEVLPFAFELWIDVERKT